ncbi:MAG: hypothetical protein SPF83_08980 [Butyricimonas virosa]|uniref:hypothetical protein n=1 Tax=Butyricimonas virosa TaxID=544645 RepID=UPI002A90B8EF|nr:hypothetical protein [Butyricimonas virosa]MDY5533779.1 hypothetical protein [Butyricimonas virosa]
MRIRENSKFIFIATSSNYLEDRFMYDISHGIEILKSLGVAAIDIIVITDAPKDTLVAKCINMSDVSFHIPSNLKDVIESAECENLFVVSSCHGSIDGIDSVTPIKPFTLNQSLKNNKYAKNILVFLGQCFAGIFNFIDVRDENKNIVYIGATDIDASLSYLITGCDWVANISVFALFQWIKTPLDIDGDGKCSISDLYKYVSYFTNNITQQIEKSQNYGLVDAFVKLKLEEKQAQSPKGKLTLQIVTDAVETIRNYIVPHQNTWMLNAIAAGNMNLE